MALPALRTREDLAPLAGWDPFDALDRFERELSTFLDRVWSLPDPIERLAALPAVEDTGDAYVVRVDLPGVARSDVEVEVAGRRLVVHGERTEKGWRRLFRRHRPRTTDRFRFEVTLPGPVDDDGVEARLDGGVLTVRLPRPAWARPRRIPIR